MNSIEEIEAAYEEAKFGDKEPNLMVADLAKMAIWYASEHSISIEEALTKLEANSEPFGDTGLRIWSFRE